jgi:hypothetical protein
MRYARFNIDNNHSQANFILKFIPMKIFSKTKKHVLTLVLLFALFGCWGQKAEVSKKSAPRPKYLDEVPGNSLYVEFVGSAYAFGSLNYEKIFIHKQHFYLSGRVGAGYGSVKPGTSYRVDCYAFPVLINGFFQVSDHFLFEFGAGSTLTYAKWSAVSGSWLFNNAHNAGSQFCPFIALNAGIRVQAEKGFLFRLGFTPLIQVTTLYGNSQVFFPWGGISVGYSF